MSATKFPMIELNRRWFLIGSAAAIGVASAQLPLTDARTPVPAQRAYGWRKISRILISADLTERPDTAIRFEIMRNNVSLFNITMNSRGRFVWLSPGPMYDLVILHADALLIKMEGVDSLSFFGAVELICEDKVGDGKSILVSEVHTFPDNTVTTAEVHA